MRELPFDSGPGPWRVAAEEHRVEDHLGRPSLLLGAGFACADGVDVLEGVVEVDLAFGPEPGENALVVAVSESFGGWGLQARLVD